MTQPTRFEIHIEQTAIDDLHQRLRATRLPQQMTGKEDDWTAGTPVSYLQSILDYWLHDFDWRAQENRLNRLPQYLTEVDGIKLHFVHRPSPHQHAVPLVLTHGWPGSFVEFRDLVDALAEPEKHGGDAADAFHVICPSLPGYTFSEAAVEPGMNTAAIARLQRKLVQQLGYDRYAVQGGDWGAAVSAAMARQDPEHCIGLHLNMVIALPPQGDDPMAGVTADEMQGVQDLQHWMTAGNGYFRIQATRPNTLGFALSDSPAGLAAWILEKFRDWSDCDGDIASTLQLDQVLTNISLYWFTGSITSAARLYYEEELAPSDFSPISVPTAGALFPRELVKPPRVWADKIYNIQRWTRYDRGGHFAAMEVPELLLADIRQFFRTVRSPI